MLCNLFLLSHLTEKPILKDHEIELVKTHKLYHVARMSNAYSSRYDK